MEVLPVVKRRQFRSKPEILELLKTQRQSGLSIQAFCAERSIPPGSFHTWKKKYGTADDESAVAAFSPLHIKSTLLPSLFAEVKEIKLYQAVSAAYLKDLAS